MLIEQLQNLENIIKTARDKSITAFETYSVLTNTQEEYILKLDKLTTSIQELLSLETKYNNITRDTYGLLLLSIIGSSILYQKLGLESNAALTWGIDILFSYLYMFSKSKYLKQKISEYDCDNLECDSAYFRNEISNLRIELEIAFERKQLSEKRYQELLEELGRLNEQLNLISEPIVSSRILKY